MAWASMAWADWTSIGEHHFTEGKEDSEGKTPGAATLYLTAYTPFDREIRIRDKVSCYH